ncbi:MAG: DUF6510 family protein [Gaiellaceae bacterium]
MDELRLDGNTVAGLLQEVFAVDMTTAGWDLWLRQAAGSDRASATPSCDRGRPRYPLCASWMYRLRTSRDADRRGLHMRKIRTC